MGFEERGEPLSRTWELIEDVILRRSLGRRSCATRKRKRSIINVMNVKKKKKKERKVWARSPRRPNVSTSLTKSQGVNIRFRTVMSQMTHPNG